MAIYNLALASIWGLLAGIITTIPLGPTGALILTHATKGDRKSVLNTIFGFSVAHIILQIIYHFGLAQFLQSHNQLIRLIALPAIAMMAFMGFTYLKRARALYRGESMIQKSVSHWRPVLRGPFAQSFTLAILNPILLVWMIANVAMFLEFTQNHQNTATVPVLLFATLVGTVGYYFLFGLWITRHAHSWSLKNRSIAEAIAGLLMLFASLSLALRF